MVVLHQASESSRPSRNHHFKKTPAGDGDLGNWNQKQNEKFGIYYYANFPSKVRTCLALHQFFTKWCKKGKGYDRKN